MSDNNETPKTVHIMWITGVGLLLGGAILRDCYGWGATVITMMVLGSFVLAVAFAFFMEDHT